MNIFVQNIRQKEFSADNWRNFRLVCKYWAEKLELANCQINSERKDFGSFLGLYKAKKLFIDSEEISIDPGKFSRLVSLKIGFLGLNVSKFTKLIKLEIYPSGPFPHYDNKRTIDGIYCLTNLVSLISGGSVISREITGLVKLTKLDVLRLDFEDKSLSCLTNLVYFHAQLIGDDHLAGLFNLRTLVSTSSNITFKGLSKLTNLHSLSYHCNRGIIDDRALQHLTNLSSLCHIYGTPTHFSNFALSKLIRLKKLSISYDVTSALTSDCLTGLTNLLDLACSSELISNSSAPSLIKLEKLQLYSSRATNLDDVGLAHLVNLKELACKNEFTNLGISALSNLQRLTINDVESNITGSAFAHMPYLRKVTTYYYAHHLFPLPPSLNDIPIHLWGTVL
jgi:hypothetical protein